MGLYATTTRRRIVAVLVFLGLLALPWGMGLIGQEFYVSFASRVLIMALAATSLNLVIGFGGMVSFGHAAFFGAGAYCVAVLAESGVTSAWLAWPAAGAIATKPCGDRPERPRKWCAGVTAGHAVAAQLRCPLQRAV